MNLRYLLFGACLALPTLALAVDGKETSFFDLSGKAVTESEFQAVVERDKLRIAIKRSSSGTEIRAMAADPSEVPSEDLSIPVPADFKDLSAIPLNDLRGKPLVVESGHPYLVSLWFSDCKPCIKEIPMLNDLMEKHGGSTRFLTVTFEESAAINLFVSKYGLKLPVARMAMDELRETFFVSEGAFVFPAHFLFDASGKLRTIFQGEPSRETLEKAIADLG